MAEEEKKKTSTVVTVIESGPLQIKGNIILKDLQRDTESIPGEVWLCRCGRSANKPFCDGSHKNK